MYFSTEIAPFNLKWTEAFGVDHQKATTCITIAPAKDVGSLQRYLSLVFKQGTSLHLTDALSRAHLTVQHLSAAPPDINLVEHMISDPQLVRFVEETKQDEILLSCKR